LNPVLRSLNLQAVVGMVCAMDLKIRGIVLRTVQHRVKHQRKDLQRELSEEALRRIPIGFSIKLMAIASLSALFILRVGVGVNCQC
jgi:hypothetical protein